MQHKARDPMKSPSRKLIKTHRRFLSDPTGSLGWDTLPDDFEIPSEILAGGKDEDLLNDEIFAGNRLCFSNDVIGEVDESEVGTPSAAERSSDASMQSSSSRAAADPPRVERERSRDYDVDVYERPTSSSSSTSSTAENPALQRRDERKGHRRTNSEPGFTKWMFAEDGFDFRSYDDAPPDEEAVVVRPPPPPPPLLPLLGVPPPPLVKQEPPVSMDMSPAAPQRHPLEQEEYDEEEEDDEDEKMTVNGDDDAAPPPPPPVAARRRRGSSSKKDAAPSTKLYKCSRCGMIKANHICPLMMHTSMAVACQADTRKLMRTHGEKTLLVRCFRGSSSTTEQ